MYAEFYGLRSEPFLITPDHRFYFESSVHAQAMAHLYYGLNRGEGFIVITGDIGAGKTTLVQQLCASINTKNVIAAHVVTTMLDGPELLRVIASAFGMPILPQEKGALLIRLQEFFRAVHKDGRRALLIVDEAQNLSVSALEELRMLSNFQVGNSAPFQSFLVAQPQFRDTIVRPELEQLRQRVIAAYHLGPMGRKECGQYVLHRLRQVEWRDDPHFDESALDAIFDHSEGVPRKINTLCSRLMLLGFLENLHQITAEEVNKVAADLATETSFGRMASAGTADPLRSGAHDNGPEIINEVSMRLASLEERLSNQAKLVRETITAVYALLNWRKSDDARLAAPAKSEVN